MPDPSETAGTTLAPRKGRTKLGPSWLVGAAPQPEPPDVRDRKGAQKGMALALLGGGVFWAAAIAAATYFLRH